MSGPPGVAKTAGQRQAVRPLEQLEGEWADDWAARADLHRERWAGNKNAPPPPAPAYNWTGFYVGINGGGGFGHSDWSNALGTNGYNLSGAVVGGTIGYNYPLGQAVFGLEGDGVELETLKPAEDGEGYIVRLLETAGRKVTARLSSRLLEFSGAWLCNATEDNLREIPTLKDGVDVAVPPYGIVTLRLSIRPAVLAVPGGLPVGRR